MPARNMQASITQAIPTVLTGLGYTAGCAAIAATAGGHDPNAFLMSGLGVAASVFANRLDSSFTSWFKLRPRVNTAIDPNHTLPRAAFLSSRVASYCVGRRFTKREHIQVKDLPTWIVGPVKQWLQSFEPVPLEEAAAGPWLKHYLKLVTNDYENCAKAGWDAKALETLAERVEEELGEVAHHLESLVQNASGLSAQNAIATQATEQMLTGLLDAGEVWGTPPDNWRTPPAGFEELFRAEWFRLLSLDFVARLQHHSEVFNMFVATQLAAIREIAPGLSEATCIRLDDTLQVATRQMGTIAETVIEIKSNTSQLLEGQRRIERLLSQRPDGNIGADTATPSLLCARASPTEFLQGLPPRWTDLVEGFLTNYIGTQLEPAPFGGRDKKLTELDEWLASKTAPRYGLIEARGGLGKSALLAHWVMRLKARPTGCALIYFPISARYETNSPAAFFQSISWRLAALFGESPPQGEDESRLREVIRLYLDRGLENEQKQLLVVIDGLDEAVWRIGIDLVPARARTHVRVLAAARPFGDRMDWLSRLGWQTRGVAKSFSLEALDREGLEDVLLQMGDPLARLSGKINLTETLYRLSNGDPLLIRLYVDRLRDELQDVDAFDSAHLERIEPGIRGFFRSWLADQEQLWGSTTEQRKRQVRVFLGLCSLAHGRLTTSDLHDLASECFASRPEVETTAFDLRRLIEGEGRQNGYVVSHPCFANFFRDEELEDAERRDYLLRFVDHGKRVVKEFGNGERRKVPDYVVRWHAAHLEEAESPLTDFSPLLNAAWCREWERLEGTPTGFLGDLDRACRRAVNQPELGLLIRISLLRSSIFTRGRTMSPELFSRSVRDGLINLTLAEVIARQQETPKEICEYLLVILGVSAKDRARLFREAIRTALQIVDKFRQIETFRALIKELCSDDRELLDEVLASTDQIRDDWGRIETVRAVLDRLKPGDQKLLHHALVKIRQARTNSRAEPLVAISDLLDPGEQVSVLEQAREAVRSATLGEGWKVKVLCSIAQRSGELSREAVLKEALEIARTTARHYGHSLKDIAEALRAGDRDFFSKTYLAATEILDQETLAEVLCSLATRLTGPEREAILQEALGVACQIADNEDRASTVAVVVRNLTTADDKALRKALEAARQIDNEVHRGDLLRVLAERAAGHLEISRKLLDAVRQMHGEFLRMNTLCTLSQWWFDRDREEALREALALAQHLEHDYERVNALKNLTARLVLEDRELLQEVLKMAETITDESHRAAALIFVSDRLGPDERRHVLREALLAVAHIQSEETRANAFKTVLVGCTPNDRPLLRECLGLIQEMHDEYYRASALIGLVERLNIDDRPFLVEILDVAQKMEHTHLRLELLRTITARLSPADRELLIGALPLFPEIDDAGQGVEALIALAERLDLGQREQVLRHAIIAIRKAPELTRASALIKLTAALSPSDTELASEVLAEARRIQRPEARSEALSSVAALFAGATHDQVLHEALDAAQQCQSVGALCTVVERFTSGDTELLQRALKIAASTGDEFAPAEVLLTIAARLERDAKHEALRDALDAVVRGHLKIEEMRVRLLKSIAECCEKGDQTLQKQLIESARQIPDEQGQANAIIAIAGHLSAEDRHKAFWQALSIARCRHEYDCAKLLMAVLGTLNRGDQQLLAEAVDIAAQIKDVNYRAMALSVAIALLEPQDQRPLRQALEIVEHIHDEAFRSAFIVLLAKDLDLEDRQTMRTKSTEQLKHIEMNWYRAKVLNAMYPVVADKQEASWNDAFELALQLTDAEQRAIALMAVADRLDEKDRALALKKALEAARQIVWEGSRARALAAISERFSAEPRQEALWEALTAALEIDREGETYQHYVFALGAVAEHLRPSDYRLISEILIPAAGIGSSYSSDGEGLLTKVLSKLDARGLAAMADRLRAIAVWCTERPRILTAVANCWTEFCQFRNRATWEELSVWLESLSRIKRKDFMSSLIDLLPAIEASGGKLAIAETAAVIADVESWWP